MSTGADDSRRPTGDQMLARLQAANPDLLLVAFGAPKQEKWVNLHVRRWRVPHARAS